MLLENVRIHNFRSLKDTGWVHIHDITAFIGENDGGKTACTSAIQLIFEKNSKVEEGDFTWEKSNGQNQTLRAETIILEAKLKVKNEEKEEVSSILGEKKCEIHIKKVFHLNGTIDMLLFTQIPEIEEFREDWESKTIPLLKELAGKYNIDLEGVSKKGEIVEKINEWVNMHPKVPGEKLVPSRLLSFLPRVEIFSSTKGNPEEIVNSVLKLLCKNEITNEKYSGSIKAIEEGITQTLKQKVNELTPHICKYYDEVKEVQIDPVFSISSGIGNTPLKLLKEGGGPIELERKGDGKKRQVALGIYEWSTTALNSQDTQDDVILIMDEPDTHMDYNSQRKLYDIICTYVSPKMQLIVCTHSLNLINRMAVNKINHFSLDDDGYTCVEYLKFEDGETEEFFINEIGHSIGLDTGTMFHERCFLIVEGPTEAHALPQFFKLIYGKSMHSAGIKLINGESNGGVRNFAKFLNNNNRKVLFLLDSDCVSGPHQRIFNKDNLIRDGFDIQNQVFFIGQMEFEDSFTDETYVSFANESYPRTDGRSWEFNDFSNLRMDGKFSEKLTRLFREGKPSIGYKMGNYVKEKEIIPQAIIEVLKKADEFANG